MRSHKATPTISILKKNQIQFAAPMISRNIQPMPARRNALSYGQQIHFDPRISFAKEDCENRPVV